MDQQAGIKKNKKKKNQQNAPTDQQQSDGGSDFPSTSSQKTAKVKQQQLKEKKPSTDLSQKVHQKQQPFKEAKSTKVPDSTQEQQPQSKNGSLRKLPNVAQQKDQQTKEAKPIKVLGNGSHKQSKAASFESKVPDQIKMNPSCDQQVDQQIEIFKKTLNIPKRKNQKVGGTLGRKTAVDVNYLPLNLDELYKKTVYHVDCLFTPALPQRLLRNALEQFVDKHYKGLNFGFDGKRNMYTTKKLMGKTDLVTVFNDENGKSMDFTIVTSVVNEIDMSKIEDYLNNGSSNCPPGEAFQALDIVLKNRPFALRFTNAGRSFFPIPRISQPDLGEGMELWKGFFQSPVIGWKPFLNIDVSHKGFPKHQLLTSYIQNELKSRLDTELDGRAQNTLFNYVKGLKVDFIIPNQPNTRRTYRVVGLLETAAKLMFEMEDRSKFSARTKSRTISIVEYFKKHKNYIIKYPNLPCLHIGNINKKTAIPIELCTVQKGQIRLKKLTDNQAAQMVKNAARPPAERQEAIDNSIKDIKYNQDPVLKEFGISVQEKFATIPARVLNQPTLASFQNKEIKPVGGVWKASQFFNPAKLKQWVVLNLDNYTSFSQIKKLESLICQSGKELNVQVSPMQHAINISPKRHLDIIKKDLVAFFNNIKKLPAPMELVVVIIPDIQGIYGAVKQVAEMEVGLLTQCIRSKTMSKISPPTTVNIILKINAKLNGINYTLSAKSYPRCIKGAIIFGADVSHPSPDQLNIPSIAAVTASHDFAASQYNMEWKLQSPKVEIIQDLENIVHKQLLKYKDRTHTIPKKIFYYRDGVSDGQFEQLLQYELVCIRRACLRLNPNYKPGITFIVVQKRHHTRMFAKQPIDMDGKFKNVYSGTIIDTHITHPTEFDFFLCSHASIQGTSRPTKYHLIWDDGNYTNDELEELTFYLCFMFARCTRSVSYPAPTYYAHLAAFRARVYIENKKIDLNRLDDERLKSQLSSIFANESPMHFI